MAIKHAIITCVAMLLSACGAPKGDGTVYLRGKVEMPMAEKVNAAIQAGQRSFVIDSRGGSLVSGMTIGSILKNAGASLTVAGECFSACALILVAVPDRHAAPGASIAFHDAGAQNPMMIKWLERHGVDPALAIGNINLRPMTPTELEKLGVQR